MRCDRERAAFASKTSHEPNTGNELRSPRTTSSLVLPARSTTQEKGFVSAQPSPGSLLTCAAAAEQSRRSFRKAPAISKKRRRLLLLLSLHHKTLRRMSTYLITGALPSFPPFLSCPSLRFRRKRSSSSHPVLTNLSSTQRRISWSRTRLHQSPPRLFSFHQGRRRCPQPFRLVRPSRSRQGVQGADSPSHSRHRGR
jgi:hypothetical protein